MKKFLLVLFTFIALTFFQPPQAEAQLRKGVATIIFAGLGGAVLGLSTLSFYGNPQDHLGNISTGFALGVIAGTGFVAMDSAAVSHSPDVMMRPWEVPTNPSQVKIRRYAINFLDYQF